MFKSLAAQLTQGAKAAGSELAKSTASVATDIAKSTADAAKQAAQQAAIDAIAKSAGVDPAGLSVGVKIGSAPAITATSAVPALPTSSILSALAPPVAAAVPTPAQASVAPVAPAPIPPPAPAPTPVAAVPSPSAPMLSGCTCSCPVPPEVAQQKGGRMQRGGGAQYQAVGLREYGDKLVNLVSMHARKVYRPTEKQLDRVEDALSEMVKGGVNLTNTGAAYMMLHTNEFKAAPGYKKLTAALKSITKSGQQSGGAGDSMFLFPKVPSHPVWLPETPLELGLYQSGGGSLEALADLNYGVVYATTNPTNLNSTTPSPW